MRKMSAFLELPGEPAFREVQVILTGKTPGSDRKLPEYPELYKGGDPDTDTFRQTCDPWEKPCDPLLYNP